MFCKKKMGAIKGISSTDEPVYKIKLSNYGVHLQVKLTGYGVDWNGVFHFNFRSDVKIND